MKPRAELAKLNHDSLLALLRDHTNTVELRRGVIRLLQDRGHRPLGAPNLNHEEITVALETIAPTREKPRSWLHRVFGVFR